MRTNTGEIPLLMHVKHQYMVHIAHCRRKPTMDKPPDDVMSMERLV